MRIDALVVGAGPAGLAVSACLAARSVDHVVLERGQVANSWRNERWDSLTLLTPNWMRRLPGTAYDGPDPDGFSTKDETIGFLDRYATAHGVPVQCGVNIDSIVRVDNGFEVSGSGEIWECSNVVVATGASSRPVIPAIASSLPESTRQIDALSYRNPGTVAGDGEILVVGAGASGVQLAHELAAAGREVTISVGGHVRLPRSYRGRDVHWWMHEMGRLDEPWHQVDDINRARHVPSPQLTGSPDHHNIDLNTLMSRGVHPVGKLMAIDAQSAWLSGSLANVVANSDLKQNRLLAEIDDHIASHGLDTPIGPSRPEPTAITKAPVSLDIARFETVLWATGHRPDWTWIDSRALDHKGRVRHDGGVSPIPGLYFIGLPYLRRRSSTFIDGIGRDATDITEHLVARLPNVVSA